MDERVLFKKGNQKKFIQEVMKKIFVKNVVDILQFGIEINDSTLRNYYNEKRLMPIGLVRDLCGLSKINFNELNVKILGGNWGQSFGGKVGKRR